MIYAVIGANYGDEGKGYTVAHLCMKHLNKGENTLVVRHNGGAQAGHTVDLDNTRFVFHQIGAGAIYNADTFWAKTMTPDPFLLIKEVLDFKAEFGRVPKIYADAETKIVIPFDALINQEKENNRGKNRHGSCGMGLWEAELRNKAGYGITLREIAAMSTTDLAKRLSDIFDKYVLKRAKELNILTERLLLDVYTIASKIKMAMSVIYLIHTDRIKEFISGYKNIVFETGQGLALDCAREDLWPHVTSSHTDLTNPLALCEKWETKLDEVVYVTRTYATRHGAGPFPAHRENLKFEDKTNIPNPWQGTMRFGYLDIEKMLARIDNDKEPKYPIKYTLMITHANETNWNFLVKKGKIPIGTFKNKHTFLFDKIYVSYSKNPTGVVAMI